MDISGTILIADDEELARRALEAMLNRHFPELEIAARATSGRQAIELYDTVKPDLVFMDIKMPGISGTDAAARILQKDPAARIIMLTAYDSFDFAQEAINSGVKAYLLKPINSDGFIQTVTKVMSRPQGDPRKSSSPGISAYLDTELVNALTAHKPLWEKIDTIDALAGHKLKGGFFSLIAGDIPMEELTALIREASSRHSYLCAPVYGFTAVLFLLDAAGYTPGGEIRIANRLFNALQQAYPHYSRLAYGPWGEGKGGIRRSFEVSLAVLMNQSSPGIYDAQDLDAGSLEASEKDGEIDRILQEILHSLETGRIGQCRESLKSLVQYLRNIPGDFTQRKEEVNEILVHLRRFAIKKKQIPGVSQERIHTDLSRIPGQRQLALYLEESITRFLGDETPLGSQETRTLLDAFLYLQEHIFDELSLEQIADFSGVSPQYLSLKIKEKFGMNFVEYITGKRLEYAQYLLLTGNDPVKEIARKSGYADANYFSRIFKKNLGRTPLQFRGDAGEKEK